jgi:hypothetical protein
VKQNFKTDLTEIGYKDVKWLRTGPRARDLGTMARGDLDAQGPQFLADLTQLQPPGTQKFNSKYYFSILFTSIPVKL